MGVLPNPCHCHGSPTHLTHWIPVKEGGWGGFWCTIPSRQNLLLLREPPPSSEEPGGDLFKEIQLILSGSHNLHLQKFLERGWSLPLQWREIFIRRQKLKSGILKPPCKNHPQCPRVPVVVRRALQLSVRIVEFHSGTEEEAGNK